MDNLEECDAHAPRSKLIILDQSNNTCSIYMSSKEPDIFDISSDKPDGTDISTVKPDSIDISSENHDIVDISTVKPEGTDISPVKPDRADISPVKHDRTDISPVKPDRADIAPIKHDSSLDNDNISSEKPDDTDISTVKTDSTDISSENRDIVDISIVKPDRADISPVKPDRADISPVKSVITPDNDNISSGKPDDADISTVKTDSSDISTEKPNILNISTVKLNSVDIPSVNSTDILNEKNDVQNRKDRREDYSNNKLGGSYLDSVNSDVIGICNGKSGDNILNDCTEIPKAKDEETTSKIFSDIKEIAEFQSSKLGNSDNSIRKSDGADISIKTTKTPVITNDKFQMSDKHKICEPGTEFSTNQSWFESFPIVKYQKRDFFSENIWGGDNSGNQQESFDLCKSNRSGSDNSEDNTLNGERTWTADFSKDLNFSNDFSKDDGFRTNVLNDKPEDKGLSEEKCDSSDSSTNKHLIADFPNCIIESLKNKPDTVNLGGSSDTLTKDNIEMINKVIKIRNSKPYIADYENKPITDNLSTTEFDNVEVPNNHSAIPKKSCKKLINAKEHLDKCSAIPSYIIESHGILGNDSFCSNAVEETNDSQNNRVLEISLTDGLWRMEKCIRSPDVYVLTRLSEDNQDSFKCIYFNKGTKLDELLKNQSSDDLNVSLEEILDCIDSVKEEQVSFLEDSVEPSNTSGFLEERMGVSTEEIDEVTNNGNNLIDHTTNKDQIDVIVDRLLNDVFCKIEDTKQGSNEILLGDQHREEVAEDAWLDEETNEVVNDDPIYSNNSDNSNAMNNENTRPTIRIRNFGIGSQVQDISGYQGLNDSTNEAIAETSEPGNQIATNSIPQRMINCVKIVCQTAFNIILSVFTSFFYKTRSQTPTECTATQTIPSEVEVEVGEELLTETDSNNEPSTSNIIAKTVPGENMKIKTKITNFSTLFQHISATAGTDMTAERVLEDINSEVVMDIYNGFHELRTVDYGSLDLMSKCIRGCLVTLQRTLSKSTPIVTRASKLLKKNASTLDEMVKLNEDLKDLTSDAEVHLHDIDRALTGLEDFTDDFMYYKNSISKELVEFLLEEFPEILK